MATIDLSFLQMKKNKRSLTINRHKTSVSLEDDFWEYFKKLAEQNRTSVNALATEIDLLRHSDVSLASEIRLFCFKNCQKKSSD